MTFPDERDARVVVVDDHPRRREALVERLGGHARIQLIGNLGSLAQVERRHSREEVLVVLLCMPDPPTHRLRECQQLRERVRGARPVVLIDHATDAAVLGAFGSGAVGLLLCTAPSRIVHEAVLAAANGGVFVDPKLGRKVVELALHHYRVTGVFGLTAQELRVLRCIAKGRTNAQVATELGISPHTVKSHVRNILKKLEVPDRHAAAALARRHGLA